MKDLTFYTHPQSRGFNVRWMLEECSADYETVLMPFGSAMKSVNYLSINPMGKVPALKHHNSIITETVAILTYLADIFPEKQLIPEISTFERGEYYRWLCFAFNLEYAIMDKWRGIENTEQQKIAVGYGDFDTVLKVLQNHLKTRKYIVGQHFTALDIYYSGLLSWGIQYLQILPADPVLTSYFNYHITRPAYVQAQLLNKEDAKELAV